MTQALTALAVLLAVGAVALAWWKWDKLGAVAVSFLLAVFVYSTWGRKAARRTVDVPTALPPRKGTVLVELAQAEQTTVANVYDEDALADWVEAHVARKRAEFPNEDDNAS